MWSSYSVLLALEAALAVTFFAVMLRLWRKVDIADAALWVMAWATRVFASLEGARHLPGQSEVLGVYMAIQACSACALLLLVARSELRVLKERLVRHVVVQVSEAPRAEFGS